MRRATLRAGHHQAFRVGVNPPRHNKGNAPLRVPNTGAGCQSRGTIVRAIATPLSLPSGIWLRSICTPVSPLTKASIVSMGPMNHERIRHRGRALLLRAGLDEVLAR